MSKMIQEWIDILVVFASSWLIPCLLFLFIGGMVLRILNYLTLKRQYFFTKEFNKRIDYYLEALGEKKNLSFQVITKKLLLITYYEIFEVSALMKRRKPDALLSFWDRIFLVKSGYAWLIQSVVKRIKLLKFSNGKSELDSIGKHSFQENPCFTKQFGFLPTGLVNDVSNLLPGIFIVGGIFGTFLGIMKALPDLGSINMSNLDASKIVLDQFLVKIAFSMSTSIIGIVLSVVMSLVNSFFSAERTFLRTIDDFNSALSILWNRSENNEALQSVEFLSEKDAIEALAQESLIEEVAKIRKEIAKDLKKPDNKELDKYVA